VANPTHRDVGPGRDAKCRSAPRSETLVSLPPAQRRHLLVSDQVDRDVDVAAVAGRPGRRASGAKHRHSRRTPVLILSLPLPAPPAEEVLGLDDLGDGGRHHLLPGSSVTLVACPKLPRCTRIGLL
jgi:hypothetical protein